MSEDARLIRSDRHYMRPCEGEICTVCQLRLSAPVSVSVSVCVSASVCLRVCVGLVLHVVAYWRERAPAYWRERGRHNTTVGGN